jgi:hypothetical protein
MYRQNHSLEKDSYKVVVYAENFHFLGGSTWHQTLVEIKHFREEDIPIIKEIDRNLKLFWDEKELKEIEDVFDYLSERAIKASNKRVAYIENGYKKFNAFLEKHINEFNQIGKIFEFDKIWKRFLSNCEITYDKHFIPLETPKYTREELKNLLEKGDLDKIMSYSCNLSLYEGSLKDKIFYDPLLFNKIKLIDTFKIYEFIDYKENIISLSNELYFSKSKKTDFKAAKEYLTNKIHNLGLKTKSEELHLFRPSYNIKDMNEYHLNIMTEDIKKLDLKFKYMHKSIIAAVDGHGDIISYIIRKY